MPLLRLRTITYLALAFSAGSLPACKKAGASYSTHTPGDAQPGYDDAGVAERDYTSIDGEMVTPTGATVTMDAPAPEPVAGVSLSAEVEQTRPLARFRERRAARKEMASPPPAPPRDEARNDKAGPAQAQPHAQEPGAGQAEPAVAHDEQDADSRYIVYTANMRIAVFNLDEAMRKAEGLPDKYGGYLASMQKGHVVLRVPSKQLRTVMAELAEYGTVEARNLQAQDVTAEFTDVESRIRALEETQKQLLELLSQARNVQEALQVRQALDQINTELEVLEGRMRQLRNQITYSTLTLSMYERGPHDPTPSSNDPFPWVNSLGVESTEYR